MPKSEQRGGRWAGRGTIIDETLYRLRTGGPWRDAPARFGPRKTVCERPGRWSADGTRDGIFAAVLAPADRSNRPTHMPIRRNPPAATATACDDARPSTPSPSRRTSGPTANEGAARPADPQASRRRSLPRHRRRDPTPAPAPAPAPPMLSAGSSRRSCRRASRAGCPGGRCGGLSPR
ncbi:transposase [Streptomyces canus]|uniref:transposase n=1 Tax=Streptomyces canus TaxID=58343 RepID=UPI0037D99A47